jgi:hypothetical protein
MSKHQDKVLTLEKLAAYLKISKSQPHRHYLGCHRERVFTG